MASGSNNDVAAKMIGAQLQSLLKIPPIKKSEENQPTERKPRNVGNSTDEPRKYTSQEKNKDSSRFVNSEENRKGVPNPEGNVARDRFGRPFQSIDRRGRGRDFPNGPRRPSSNINQRDAQPQPPTPNDNVGIVSNEPPTPHGNHVGGEIPQSTPVARQTPTPQPQAHAEKKNFIPPHRRAPGFEASVGSKPAKPPAKPPASSLEDRMPRVAPPAYTPYEKSPRFSNEEPPKPKLADPWAVQLKQLARKPDCPPDIREHISCFEGFSEHADNINLMMRSILYRHCTMHIARRSSKFPRAKFYCQACNYHMDTLYACLLHIMQDRHSCLEKMHNIQNTCSLIPRPSPEHTSYLTDYLIKISKLHGMNTTEHMQRLDIIRRISEALAETDLDCEVMLFGSSLPGFGFRDSNVNININVGSEASTMTLVGAGETGSPNTPLSTANPAEFSEVTGKLLTVIKKLPHVSESKVKEVYTPKCVSIHFEEEKTRAPCLIHFNNTAGVLTAQLFAEYDKIDPRVKPLVLCFRHWARICDVDDQEKGFLPAHCFAIMVIMFLQRNKHILPILHLIPRNPIDKLFATASEFQKFKASSTEQIVEENTQSIGELWLDLLSFYANHNYKEYLITISRDMTVIPKAEKVWNRKMSIEDPIIPKSNLARSLSNNKVCEYIIDKIRLTYLYFAIPRETTGPLYDGVMDYPGYFDDHLFRTVKIGSKPTSSQALQRMVRQLQGMKPQLDEDGWDLSEKKEYRMIKTYFKQKGYNYVIQKDAKNLHDILFKNEHHYEFKAENFSDGSLPPIICKSCGADGHLRRSCPEETVPPYLPVEYPSPLTIARLDEAINRNYDREALDTLDVNLRQQIVDEVRTILLPVFPHVCLRLFGSTFNGFGMHSSDVDICFTLRDVEVSPGERGIRKIDVNDVLEKIVEALKGSGRMTDVLSIPSAKVPIVKFRHVAYRLDGDISLYNILSLVNTELLQLYNDLDSRVARLGLFLKKLVKRCDVGDASKGSLSSYGYILMLIHFLQNHTVPVLPVLQELQIPGDPENHVRKYCDDHLIKYLKDVKTLPLIWEHYGKNKETVGQLWLAFLNYYVEKFNNDRYVITISQSQPLSRTLKCWYTEGLALEDPFDKTHNLGFGLTRRMSVHILRTLQKCRSFFHRSTDHLRSDINFLEYYLDPRNIRDGNPPIDRQCRLCRRIGHFARNCTFNNKEEQEVVRRQEDEDPYPTYRDLPPKSLPETPRTPEKKTPKEDIGPLTSMMKKEERMNAFKFPTPQPAPLDANPWPVESHNISSPGNGILQSQLPNGLATPFENLGKSVPFPLNGDILGPVGHQQLLTQSLIPQAQSLLPQTQSMVPQSQPLIPSHINTPQYHHEEVDTANEGKPTKEVMFFGDIGSPNADGEQIQAMLQKNEGVTFTFDLASQRPLEQNSSDVMTTPEALANSMGNQVVQPPPGFCPPGNIYMANNPPTQHMPYITDQGSRQIIPTPPTQPYNIAPIGMSIQAPAVAYGHNPQGMTMSFQQMIPVGAVPYDGRSQVQVNGETNEQRQTAVAAAATAPPPGFAPLPTAPTSNIIQPPEMIRSYPPPYAIQGTPTMYTVAPVGISYQPNAYSSAPSAAVETSEPLIYYRPMESEGQTQAGTINYYGNMIPQQQQPGNSYVASSQSLANMANVSGFQQHVMPVNVGGMPNGQFENGEDGGEMSAYHKTSSVTGEHLYNAEYGAMITANHPSASSYGLSLSQAHHGPVVSALQMQHSQHHPMQLQGGHFHHHTYQHVRPYMQVGAYPPGAPYSYPAMNVAQAQQMQQGHHEAMIPIGIESSGPGGLPSLEVKHMK